MFSIKLGLLLFLTLITFVEQGIIFQKMADDEWRTQPFRQSIVQKIEETIRAFGINTPRNSVEMENHIFQKAKVKEEYLGFVARLILHIREMNSKKEITMGSQPCNPNQIAKTQQITSSNLLQASMNRGPVPNMQNMQENMQPRMAGSMSNQMGAMPQMSNQVQGPTPDANMNQLGGQMGPQINNPMGNQMDGPVQGQMGNQIPEQLPGQMQNLLL